MSTTARPPKQSPSRGVSAASARRRRARTAWIVGAIVAVVAIAGITAIVAGGGADKGDVTLTQIQPVDISGSPLPAFASPEGDQAVGLAAPTVDGLSFDDSKVSITPGRPTLLVFLAHWCPHCQAEVPRVVAWHDAGQAPADLDVIGVITGTDATLPNYPPSSWLVREEWPFPTLVDDGSSSAMAVFGFQNFPAFALIDANGVVQYRATGEIEMTDLDAVLASKLGL